MNPNRFSVIMITYTHTNRRLSTIKRYPVCSFEGSQSWTGRKQAAADSVHAGY